MITAKELRDMNRTAITQVVDTYLDTILSKDLTNHASEGKLCIAKGSKTMTGLLRLFATTVLYPRTCVAGSKVFTEAVDVIQERFKEAGYTLKVMDGDAKDAMGVSLCDLYLVW